MNFSISEKYSSIIMIILGIIALLFPMLSTGAIGFMSGIVLILLAAGFIIAGISELILTKYYGLAYIILGILSMVLACCFIFNPALVSGILGFMIYIFGILLIALGIILFFIGPLGILGIITLIYGILTIIVGYFINDPRMLGTLIGLWLLIFGISSLFLDNKDYIDV